MNIFDIIGPVMIGPSSSHTAGAVRIGRISWKILGEQAVKADIGLVGSFAMTCKGHGTDNALIAGILGMRPDDKRIALAAHLLGLGSVICGMANIPLSGARGDEFKKRMHFPDGYNFGIAILVGMLKTGKEPHEFDMGKVTII